MGKSRAGRLRSAAILSIATFCGGGSAFAQSAPDQASPLSPNAHGALVGPQIAEALHPQTTNPTPIRGPFTWLSNDMAQRGISFRGVLINQAAGNPVGGVQQGFTNVGQLNFGTDVDLGKLTQTNLLSGSSMHLTLYRDYGYSLAIQDLGTLVKQQNIYKNPYTKFHFGLFAWEQKLFDNKVDFIVGRLGSTAFYGHLVPACSFEGGSTCGIPTVLNSEAGYTLLPSATWGGNLTLNLSRTVYVESGAFEVNPSAQPSTGLDWSIEHSTGYSVPFEVGWTEPSLAQTRYPYEYKAGAWDSTAPHNDPFLNTKNQSIVKFGGTAKQDTARDGVYLMGDHVVWRPNPHTTENLNLFGGYIQPLENEEVVDRQVYVGVVVNGVIPGRPRDSIGLQGTYFHVSGREIELLDAQRAKLGGRGRNSADEGDFELNYGFQIVPGLRLLPDVQYIANPDNSQIPKTKILPKNAWVFGVALNVGWSQILGFASSVGSGRD